MHAYERSIAKHAPTAAFKVPAVGGAAGGSILSIYGTVASVRLHMQGIQGVARADAHIAVRVHSHDLRTGTVDKRHDVVSAVIHIGMQSNGTPTLNLAAIDA
ncbi:hypothetical protein HRbin16_02966 [bacterium HR16]|nr:hypothetical protein HRbin16_02966 [bacterium HR16]